MFFAFGPWWFVLIMFIIWLAANNQQPVESLPSKPVETKPISLDGLIGIILVCLLVIVLCAIGYIVYTQSVQYTQNIESNIESTKPTKPAKHYRSVCQEYSSALDVSKNNQSIETKPEKSIEPIVETIKYTQENPIETTQENPIETIIVYGNSNSTQIIEVAVEEASTSAVIPKPQSKIKPYIKPQSKTKPYIMIDRNTAHPHFNKRSFSHK